MKILFKVLRTIFLIAAYSTGFFFLCIHDFSDDGLVWLLGLMSTCFISGILAYICKYPDMVIGKLVSAWCLAYMIFMKIFKHEDLISKTNYHSYKECFNAVSEKVEGRI